MKRVAAFEGKRGKWQMLVVAIKGIRVIGVYASPSASAADWAELLSQIRKMRAAPGRSVICGDLNARHKTWDPKAKTTAGGKAVLKLLHPARGKEKALFNLRAPPGPTRYGVIKGKTVCASCIDLFLTSPGRGDWASAARILDVDGVGGSDHLPVGITLLAEEQPGRRPEFIFLPSPHRLKGKCLEVIKESYAASLPALAENFTEVGTVAAFHMVCEEAKAAIRRPCMVKVRRKPARMRNRPWSANVERLARHRSRILKQARKSGDAEDWNEKHCLDARIKRLRRRNMRSVREREEKQLQHEASRMDASQAAERLQKLERAEKEAATMGKSLKPRDFTTFFTSGKKSERAVPLRKFTLPPYMEAVYEESIRKAKNGKAKGTDGIPMELLKVCPALFAKLLYRMFKAAARLGCVPRDWDTSILIPLYKGSGEPAHPENYRPLRLILIFRKVYEMGLNVKMKEERQNAAEQFGFQARTSALGAAARMLSRVRLKRVVSVFLDLTKAYDLVLREMIMRLVSERYSDTVVGMVATILQESIVFTQGDETGLRAALDRGVTQGGPSSPDLFNILMDTLIFIVNRALAVLKRKDCTPEWSPIMAFADDIVLQAESDVEVAIACRAAAGWAGMSGMNFNCEMGKSGVLVERGAVKSGVQLGENVVLGSLEEKYLGVTVARHGATDTALMKRVRGAQAALRALVRSKVLVKGMDVKRAVEFRKTFLESRWRYGMYLAPLGKNVTEAIDALDARFIAQTVCPVFATDKEKLAKLRALLHIDSPRLARCVAAHQFKSRTAETVADESLPPVTRERARRVLKDLPMVPGFEEQVGKKDESAWDRKEIRKRRGLERAQAFGKNIPPVREGGGKLPWFWRLPQPWARELAARYFCGTFPIFGGVNNSGKNGVLEKVVQTTQEKEAQVTLRLLHEARNENDGNVDKVMKALAVLRVRGDCSVGLRKGRRAKLHAVGRA